MLTIILYSVFALFLLICLFMTLLILIQKGRGGGLAGAFGGAGGNTAFGAKTGDVLTWTTAAVFGVFLLLAVGLNLLAERYHETQRPTVRARPAAVPATPASPAPVAPADAAAPTNAPVDAPAPGTAAETAPASPGVPSTP